MSRGARQADAATSAQKALLIIAGLSVAALSALLALRAFVYQPFSAPSQSNAPNLMEGDYFLVSKLAYRSSDPVRGELAVFKLPIDGQTDYIKRVIGLPGERIQMRGGVLHINGEAAKLEPVSVAEALKTAEGMRFFRETLPDGRGYVIADMGTTPADDTGEYRVPEGHYFVMGDNRDNSQDSRFAGPVGFIPRENFVGPLAFRIFNSHGLPISQRPAETYAPG